MCHFRYIPSIISNLLFQVLEKNKRKKDAQKAPTHDDDEEEEVEGEDKENEDADMDTDTVPPPSTPKRRYVISFFIYLYDRLLF